MEALTILITVLVFLIAVALVVFAVILINEVKPELESFLSRYRVFEKGTTEQLKKLEEHLNRLLSLLRSQSEDISNDIDGLTSRVVQFDSENKNRWARSEKTLSNVEKKVDPLDEVLRTLNYSSKEKWAKKINGTKNVPKKLAYLEAAIKHFPSEKTFIVEARKILTPRAREGDNLLVRREALMRLREYANLFVEACKVNDLNYALEFKKDITENMELVVKKIDELRKNNLKKLLETLNKSIKKLKKNPADDKLLEKIEQIDQRIDNNIIKNYPKLEAKYNELSKTLMQILKEGRKELAPLTRNQAANGEMSKEQIRKINEEALKVGKQVMDNFQTSKRSLWREVKKLSGSQKKNFSDTDIKKTAELLSKHPKDKLLYSTKRYLQMAENEFFQKLSPEHKITFTEYMIKFATR